MEALYKEAFLCTQGEERARTLLESIRLRTADCHDTDNKDSRWLEYATAQTHLAIYDFQTRAVEVDGWIEANTPDLPPFTSQAMRILEALEVNLEALSSEEENNGPAFQMAVTTGDVVMVGLFIQAGVDPSVVDNYAIQRASGSGHLQVVNRLLQDGRVDPSALDNGAIRWASSQGHPSVVDRLLLDARVDPSAVNNAAVQMASQNGHLMVVDRLLQDARVDPSAKSNRAIQWASCQGHPSVVDRLLQDARVASTLDAGRIAAYRAQISA